MPQQAGERDVGGNIEAHICDNTKGQGENFNSLNTNSNQNKNSYKKSLMATKKIIKNKIKILKQIK